MSYESDFDGRGIAVLLLVHTLIVLTVGYYFGLIGGVREGKCQVACKESERGHGQGHFIKQECTCTIVYGNGRTESWTESIGSE